MYKCIKNHHFSLTSQTPIGKIKSENFRNVLCAGSEGTG